MAISPRSTFSGPTALLGHSDAATALKTAEPKHQFRRPRSAQRSLLSLVVVAEPVLASNTTFKPTMNNFADGMITAKLKNTIQLVPTINSQGQQVYVPDPRAAATATRFSARMGQFGVSLLTVGLGVCGVDGYSAKDARGVTQRAIAQPDIDDLINATFNCQE
jgi:hypothetical protein